MNVPSPAAGPRLSAIDVLRNSGRVEEALELIDKLAEAAPDDPNLVLSRALALEEAARYPEALANFDRALELVPRSAKVRYYKSFLLLRLGDYRQGLELHEARLSLARAFKIGTPLNLDGRWRGDPRDLAGRRLYLFTEQGFGDAIQFVRYAPLAARLPAASVLNPRREHQTLFARMGGIDVDFRPTHPLFAERWASVFSLPLHFGTTIDTIPSARGYLSADPARVERWRDRSPAWGPRVGVAWSGSAAHSHDAARSVPLRYFAKLFEASARFIVVQKDLRPGDAEILERHRNVDVVGPCFDDFDDAAGAIAGLDLVITADTSVAHLAGALGKPVWILLPFVPDWRWLLDREDSPWYASARLFRQPILGDWPAVIEGVGQELANL